MARRMVAILASALAWGAASLAAGAASVQGIEGLYAVTGADRPPPAALFDNPNLDGISLRATWRTVEPREGAYNWATLDAAVAQAAAHGKKVNLAVTPGAGAPDWVYRGGVAAFRFTWDLKWGFPACSEVSIPVPWDPAYGEKWRGFVRALGQRYADNPAVVSVAIQGVNAQTDELLLPSQRPGAEAGNKGAKLDCGTPRDDVAAWQAAGYRPSRVVEAWRGFAAAYAKAFPRQKLVSAVGGWPFPSIDEQGQIVPQDRANTMRMLEALLRAALQVAPERFVVANNGLSAKWRFRRPAALPASVKLAYQTSGLVSHESSCRMNLFVRPCEARAMLRAALRNAAEEGAAYVEIYATDAINPELQEVLAEGRRSLAAR